MKSFCLELTKELDAYLNERCSTYQWYWIHTGDFKRFLLRSLTITSIYCSLFQNDADYFQQQKQEALISALNVNSSGVELQAVFMKDHKGIWKDTDPFSFTSDTKNVLDKPAETNYQSKALQENMWGLKKSNFKRLHIKYIFWSKSLSSHRKASAHRCKHTQSSHQPLKRFPDVLKKNA